MLRAEGLGKRFGSRWIFRNLSFELGIGDRLVILGRNGAGKSTLLRTLAGLVPKYEGQVFYPSGDPRKVVALSALEQSLYPALTVEEHLKLAGDLRGCDPRTEELIERIGLKHARKVPASRLSTGMKARVRIAIAIQARPSVLLLDEPGAGLDEEGRALVESVADEQADRGCLILATNDPLERRLATYELELAV